MFQTIHSYTSLIPNVGPPKKVEIVKTRERVIHPWRYDAERMTLAIDIEPVHLFGNKQVFEILINFDREINDQRAKLKKISHILKRAKMAKLNLDETQKSPGSHTPAPSYFAQLASMPTKFLWK